MPGYHARLGERLVATGKGDERVTVVSEETGIRLDEGVSTIRRELLARTRSWARLVSEDRRITPPQATIFDVVAFLLRHHDWLIAQEFADDYADEILEWTAKARRRIVPPRPRQYGGPCGHLTLDDNGNPIRCPGTVLVDQEWHTARCVTCGTETDAKLHWAKVFAAVDDDWLVSATEASQLLAIRDGLDLDAARVRQWAHRGRVTARGERAAQPLYRLGDLIELLDDDTASKGA